MSVIVQKNIIYMKNIFEIPLHVVAKIVNIYCWQVSNYMSWNYRCEKTIPINIPSKYSSWWRRLLPSSSENVLKTSSRWFDQEEYIRLSHSSLEDVLVKTNIFVLAICFQEFLLRRLQDIFKMSSRRFEDFFKTSSRHLGKMSSRRFQDVSWS